MDKKKKVFSRKQNPFRRFYERVIYRDYMSAAVTLQLSVALCCFSYHIAVNRQHFAVLTAFWRLLMLLVQNGCSRWDWTADKSHGRHRAAPQRSFSIDYLIDLFIEWTLAYVVTPPL